MSNCHSSQAEYDDHDFKDGICKDCGEVDRPAVKALSTQVSMLERKVTELTERNRRLANQIRGYSDRVNDSLSAVIKKAKAEALREAVSEFESSVGVGEFAEQSQRGPLRWGHIEEAWEHQGPYMDWLRARADKLGTL